MRVNVEKDAAPKQRRMLYFKSRKISHEKKEAQQKIYPITI